MIARRQLIVLLIAVLATVFPAATASAGPGGATPDAITVPGSPQIVVRVGNPLLTASANGISIAVHATALVRGRLRIDGTAPPQPSAAVQIERLDPQHGWIPVASAPLAPDGSFHALWRPNRAGAIQLRAVPESIMANRSANAGAAEADTNATTAAPQLGVTIYRAGIASWYGPGMYGTTTACGVTLEPGTLGVAHRTLPCGTPVALYRHGRTIVVPVIDRGPYLRGRTWDLTYTTFRALGGTDGLVTVGALPLPSGS